MQSTQLHGEKTSEVLGTNGPIKPPSPTGSGSERLRKADVLAVLDGQQRRCNLTGRVLTPDTAAIDHIVPLVKGGQHVRENIQVLHRQVNVMKGTLTQEEFIAVCREVVAHADRLKS